MPTTREDIYIAPSTFDPGYSPSTWPRCNHRRELLTKNEATTTFHLAVTIFFSFIFLSFFPSFFFLVIFLVLPHQMSSQSWKHLAYLRQVERRRFVKGRSGVWFTARVRVGSKLEKFEIFHSLGSGPLPCVPLFSGALVLMKAGVNCPCCSEARGLICFSGLRGHDKCDG